MCAQKLTVNQFNLAHGNGQLKTTEKLKHKNRRCTVELLVFSYTFVFMTFGFC